MPRSIFSSVTFVAPILLLHVFVQAALQAVAIPAMAQAPGGQQPSLFVQLVPFIFMFGVMYFLMIRPQMKKHKQHQEFLSKLSRGEEVITSSGIFGTIEGLTDTAVTLEIANGVRIKVLRNSIAGSARAAVAATGEVKA